MEPKIDRAAISMLQALSGNLENQLAEFDGNGAPRDMAVEINELVRSEFVSSIYYASPGIASFNDDQQVVHLSDQIRTPDIENLDQLKSQLQQRRKCRFR